MDFSKFRESGDLSDITVAVGSIEHKLHKFPLYAKSDYFCELARSKPGADAEPFKVELNDFPGGNDTFWQVANFCYNMPLNLTRNNVVAIRCAAEYLKMFGSGNLKEVSSKFLMDTISAAKLNRLTSVIVSMLMDCNDIGNMAESVGIVDDCLEAFVGCWISPVIKYLTFGNRRTVPKATPQSIDTSSAFSRVLTASIQQSCDKLDEANIKFVLSLRPDWFAMLLTKAGVKGVSSEELGSLAVKYITCALDKDDNESGEQSSKNTLRNKDSVDDDSAAIDDEKDIATVDSATNDELSPHTDTDETTVSRVYTSNKLMTKFDTGTVLETVVTALPDQAFVIPSVTMEWLTKAIRVATLHDCKCRGKLVKVAGDMLIKLDPKDLCFISPTVLHDIVVDASNENNGTHTRMSSAKACNLVDKYMVQMTKEGNLTAEAFRLLASAIKDYPRKSHDLLYTVLEFVIKSEKDTLTPEQQAELTNFVDFDLLSETNLQKAIDEKIVSPSKIANSAIKLCVRLRAELASVKYIAELQEEDIQTYHTSATRSALPTSADTRYFTAVSYRHQNTDSECTDQDDSIDKSSIETVKNEDFDSLDHYHSTDQFKSAQNALTAARHKLNLPVYTGYRPVFLSRLSPPTYVGHTYLHNYRAQREPNISLDEELDFKYDRSFQSLDPRVRHHRLLAHQSRNNNDNEQRTYFPYSSQSHRF